jgi:hypothetical protein
MNFKFIWIDPSRGADSGKQIRRSSGLDNRFERIEGGFIRAVLRQDLIDGDEPRPVSLFAFINLRKP